MEDAGACLDLRQREKRVAFALKRLDKADDRGNLLPLREVDQPLCRRALHPVLNKHHQYMTPNEHESRTSMKMRSVRYMPKYGMHGGTVRDKARRRFL